MLDETVYLGRDNSIDLECLGDGKLVDILSTTRVVLVMSNDDGDYDDVTVDSDDVDATGVFDWTTDGYDGVIHVYLGPYLDSLNVGEDVVVGEGDWTGKIFFYNQNNVNGLFWDYILLHVIEP